MGKYLERARAIRSDKTVHYNCAQAVVLAFAEDFGISRETACDMTAHFGSGMRMGSVCGAISGALMVLGFAGMTDPADASYLLNTIKEAHGGLYECRDLLRKNAERGGDRKQHCDGMVFEAVELLEQMLKGRGRIG